MTVDSVITLENDVNCLLLEKVNYENDNYFLAVVLTIDEEPSNNYVIFKEILVIRFWLLATAFLLVVTFVIFGFSYLNVDRRRADRAEQILRFTE